MTERLHQWRLQFMDNSTRIIVSLSTIPPRFTAIGNTLYTLLSQSTPPDDIELYIPRSYRRFGEHAFCVPETPEGIKVKVIDHDYGPATKVLPCAENYRGTNTRIIYCDDDRLYSPFWLQQILKTTYQRSKDCVCNFGYRFEWNKINYKTNKSFTPHAKRLRGLYKIPYYLSKAIFQIRHKTTVRSLKHHHFGSSGYVDIALGFGGVSVSPDFFDESAKIIPKILWTVDDVWLSGHIANKGIGIWLDQFGMYMPLSLADEVEPLYLANIDGADRNQADLACIEYFKETYGIWK